MKTLIIFLIIINTTFSYAQIYENWVIRYNGPLNARDEATAVNSDQAGNVFVTGYSKNLNGDMDYVTQKYNACGNLKWSNIYNWGSDFAVDIGIDGSGNVFTTGFLYGEFGNDIFGTLKYNPDGNNQWVRHLFGPVHLSHNTPKKLLVDNAGNSFITGVTSQTGSLFTWDAMTAKYNSSGELQWQKYYNGPGNHDDTPEDIYVDSQGNSYVTGGSFGNGTDNDFFILKYSAGGTLLNVVRYNGDGNGSDGAYSINLDELGNIYVTGQSQEYENPVEGSDG